MKRTMFVSYGHSDDIDHQWVQRLNMYLDCIKEELPIDVWDDTRIGAGENWRTEIGTAISQAAVAVLLVGPGFLASKFVKENELPELLRAKEAGTLRLYPLVVAYCPWKLSILEPYQAFNDPDDPLEKMETAEQNMWLNNLVVAIAEDMRSVRILPAKYALPVNDLRTAISAIMDRLEVMRTAFVTQARRRDGLVEKMQKRLKITEQFEYEQFFFHYYDHMDEEERFEFNNIRATTEGLLHDNNRSVLDIIETTPDIRKELPILSALRLHLVVWLNKYDKVFTTTQKMCVLYVGVEDGVPFPYGVDQAVAEWLIKNKA